MRSKVIGFVKRETVLLVACVLAVISCFLVPPDAEYVSYIDWRTLALLFCLMSVMAGFQETGAFQKLGTGMLLKTKSGRGVAFVLVFLCFLCSMWITNDVALITFVPFGLLVLRLADMERSVSLTVTLMTIAANLGSMLTPIGNPQNLYLYTASGRSFLSFIGLMLPYTLLAAALLATVILCACPNPKISVKLTAEQKKLPAKPLALYSVLFLLCLLTVLKLIPIYILFPAVAVVLLIFNRKLLLKVDYSLLLTFAAFFIFVGNMGRVPALHELILRVVTGHEQTMAVALSQIISNVPAALLLSGFTENTDALIVGTNLGGLGTLIASMASLISYKQIALQYGTQKKRYLLLFTLWNVLFLAALLLLSAAI